MYDFQLARFEDHAYGSQYLQFWYTVLFFVVVFRWRAKHSVAFFASSKATAAFVVVLLKFFFVLVVAFIPFLFCFFLFFVV